MRILGRYAGLLLPLVLIVALPRAARAFVRYKTSAGLPFSWAQTCVPLTVYPKDFTDLTSDQTVHAVTAAAAAWSAEGNACTFMKVQVGSSSAPTPTATLDGRSWVIFRTTSWCAPSDPPGTCSYPPETLAITSVFVRKTDGTILEGDVEVNAKNFVWTDRDLDPSGAFKQDLQNAMTHELGHLLGLADTCVQAGTTPVPLDNAGQAVPSCDTASLAVQATTMFASATPGDVSKRTLAPDDLQGLCTIYPEASNPAICPSADADGGSDGGPVDGAAEVGADGTVEVGAAEVGVDGTVEVGKVEVGVDGAAGGAAGHAGAEAGAADGPGPKLAATTGGCGCDVVPGGRGVVTGLTFAAFMLAGRGRGRATRRPISSLR